MGVWMFLIVKKVFNYPLDIVVQALVLYHFLQKYLESDTQSSHIYRSSQHHTAKLEKVTAQDKMKEKKEDETELF